MSANRKPIRVFQVATGNVGSEMIRRIADRPDLELIGVHCYSADKVGKDAGELAGSAPNGVTATGSVDESRSRTTGYPVISRPSRTGQSQVSDRTSSVRWSSG